MNAFYNVFSLSLLSAWTGEGWVKIYIVKVNNFWLSGGTCPNKKSFLSLLLRSNGHSIHLGSNPIQRRKVRIDKRIYHIKVWIVRHFVDSSYNYSFPIARRAINTEWESFFEPCLQSSECARVAMNCIGHAVVIWSENCVNIIGSSENLKKLRLIFITCRAPGGANCIWHLNSFCCGQVESISMECFDTGILEQQSQDISILGTSWMCITRNDM